MVQLVFNSRLVLFLKDSTIYQIHSEGLLVGYEYISAFILMAFLTREATRGARCGGILQNEAWPR